MGTAKKVAKGLVAGIVLGAAAAYAAHAAQKDPKGKAATKAARDVAKRATAHAKKIGAITKSAYDAIVEKTLAEARGAKTLSRTEVDELHAELRASWKDLSKMLMTDTPKTTRKR